MTPSAPPTTTPAPPPLGSRLAPAWVVIGGGATERERVRWSFGGATNGAAAEHHQPEREHTMGKRSTTKRDATTAPEQDTTTDAEQDTTEQDGAPEQDTTTEQDGDTTTEQDTTDPVDGFVTTWNHAVTNANGGVPDPADQAATVAAFVAITKRGGKRDAALVRVTTDTNGAAVTTNDDGTLDVDGATLAASSALASACHAAASAPATERGANPSDTVGARVVTLAALALATVTDANARALGVEHADATLDGATLAAFAPDAIPSSVLDAVVTLATTLDATDTDAVAALVPDAADALANAANGVERGAAIVAAAWPSAFGGRVPDATTLPRSGGGGGGGASANRRLDALPDGVAIVLRHGDTEHAATIVHDADASAPTDGAVVVTDDGQQHASASAAARHVNGGAQINGWTAWRVGAPGDGVRHAKRPTIASVHDGEQDGGA